MWCNSYDYINGRLFFVTGPKIPLNRICGPDDECLNQNAECQGGVCLCIDTHFDRHEVCSKQKSIVYLYYHVGGYWLKRFLHCVSPKSFTCAITLMKDFTESNSRISLSRVDDKSCGALVSMASLMCCISAHDKSFVVHPPLTEFHLTIQAFPLVQC